MSRREEEEIHARAADEHFVCGIWSTECGVSWSRTGSTIAEAISAAFGCCEAQAHGCGEYVVEIHAVDRD